MWAYSINIYIPHITLYSCIQSFIRLQGHAVFAGFNSWSLIHDDIFPVLRKIVHDKVEPNVKD